MSNYLIRLGFLFGVIALLVAAPLMLAGVAAAEGDEADEEIDYKTLENPVPFTKASIGRGRVIFKRMCTECHGPDGKGQMDVIADASDLTVPKRYYNGSTVGEIYASIRNGAGTNMPPFVEKVAKEEDLWNLVNFIQSLWPDKLQPELVEKEDTEPEGDGN